MSSQRLLALVLLVIVSLITGVISTGDNNPEVKRDVLSRNLSKALGGGALRILCLGASITNGWNSSDKNGYRKSLRKSLVEDGHIVNMIGSLKTGTMADNDNEGWVGYRIAEVGGKAELSLPHLPNVVLIHVGTNDCGQDFDIPHAGARLATVVDSIFDAVPGVTIIVSTLLPTGETDAEANTLIYNAALVQVVNVRSAAGKRITLVDMHGITDIASDGIHPTDAGYLEMATVFYSGILSVGDMIQPPAVAEGVNDAAAPNDPAVLPPKTLVVTITSGLPSTTTTSTTSTSTPLQTTISSIATSTRSSAICTWTMISDFWISIVIGIVVSQL